MARTFNGSTDKVTVAKASAGIALGPFTIAAIVKKTDNGAVDSAILGGDAADPAWSFYINNSSGGANADYMAFYNHTVPAYDPGTATKVVTADGWVCIGVSKATGSVVPRWHRYAYSVGTWLHLDSGVSQANPPAPTTSLFIGEDGSGSFFKGDIAAIGVWPAVLTDQQFEALAYDLMAWWQVSPIGLWLLDQSATGQKIRDLTGLGANESAISGTAVGTSSVPVFSYGAPVLGPPRGVQAAAAASARPRILIANQAIQRVASR
jgi:hypothetical protein